MQDINIKDLLEEIEYSKKRIAKDKAMWDQIIPEQISSTYFGMGLNARHIAIYNLLLGNKEGSLKWFEQAAKYYSKSRIKGRDGEVQMLMWTILMSILSGNRDLMKEHAQIFDDLEYKTPSYFYYFVSCLSNSILGNEESVLTATEKLDKLEPTNYSKLKYYKGLGKTCKGIAMKDSSLVTSGLINILKRHKSLIPSLGKTMDDALVCIPATALIILAKNQGIGIKPDNVNENYKDYIPWALFD